MTRVNLLALLIVIWASSLGATTIVVPSDTDLVGSSPAIVIAVAGDSHARCAAGGWIETVTSMFVLDVLKGSLKQAESIDVVELGGVIDDFGYVVAGSPTFHNGDTVLLFLDRDGRGWWTTKDLFVGKFMFTSDATGHQLLVRSDNDAVGADRIDQHGGQVRSANEFVEFIRLTVSGIEAPANYFVAPSIPRLSAETTPTIGSYLTLGNGASGTLPTRWRNFDSPVVFFSYGTQRGAPGEGIPALLRALGAWTDDPNSHVDYRYGGPTSDPAKFTNDKPNTVILFNDPNDEIPGSYDPAGSGTLSITQTTYLGRGADSVHTFGGEQFYTIVGAAVVVQDGLVGRGLITNGLAQILTHELGHTLGFRHSDRPAVMYAIINFDYAPYGSKLQPWDREAINAAYGSGTPCPPPVVNQQPRSVMLGETPVLLSVDSSGTPPLVYQWFARGMNGTESPIQGETNREIRVEPSSTTFYWVRIWNGCGSQTDSDTAMVVVGGPSRRRSVPH